MRSAEAGLGPPLAGGPSSVRVVANRPYCDVYCTWAVCRVRMAAMAAVSCAYMRALYNLGKAIVMMIRMIAITISNSIRENPRLFLRFHLMCVSRSSFYDV